MYTRIHNLVVVVVAFIHDEHEIEAHCVMVVVSSLQLLHDIIGHS